MFPVELLVCFVFVFFFWGGGGWDGMGWDGRIINKKIFSKNKNKKVEGEREGKKTFQ